ncbi:MAG TPA: acyl-CoA synthetase [Saprospiraceae bacterium]|nr:acyl-CoA synthetase [Saprospiraceae bacterium]
MLPCLLLLIRGCTTSSDDPAQKLAREVAQVKHFPTIYQAYLSVDIEEGAMSFYLGRMHEMKFGERLEMESPFWPEEQIKAQKFLSSGMITLIERAKDYRKRIAIKSNQQDYTYADLLEASEKIAATLLQGRADLQEARIAFIVDPSYEYVAVQWGIWRAGGVAVPLCVKHPYASIKYVIKDTGAEAVVYSNGYQKLVAPLFDDFEIRSLPLTTIKPQKAALPDVAPECRAMILYTSGTTGRPKGVVTTHQNIEAQIKSLVKSWEWSPEDHILNILPLHHVHGIINVLSCALWSGACCEFLPKFNPEEIFGLFRKGEINLFMAVPTIYYKLIAHWNELPTEKQKAISDALQQFRLMVSGSAALPISTLEKWRKISGQTLLERYGMTEMGMAISNPYRGERQPGYIGQPLAGVTVRIADENDQPVAAGQSGEIQVKGPNIFKEYWGRPKATAESFVKGWFKTGDIAVVEEGSYRILGRNSVDIIKSGGYKISALEIEEILRKHPAIKDCGVVGIPDEEWGEIIGASLILDAGQTEVPDDLRDWLKDKLPNYKVPRKYIVQDDLPRNVMGKVTKKALQEIMSDL